MPDSLGETIKITVKLYASLGRYLPPGARDNRAEIEVAADATPASVIERLNVPRDHCHLVLVNGAYVPPSERAATRLAEHDAVAIWPPVAGG